MDEARIRIPEVFQWLNLWDNPARDLETLRHK